MLASGCSPPFNHPRVPASPSLAALLQLRSLDLSQNQFTDEEGNEMATLALLTGLECLKLANCHLAQARCACLGDPCLPACLGWAG